MNQGVDRATMSPEQIRGLLALHGIAYIEQTLYRKVAAGAEVACRVGACNWKDRTEPIPDLATEEGSSELTDLVARARRHVLDQHG